DSQVASPAPASPPPEKDDGKLLDKSAVPAPQTALHEQLKAMQCPDADLTVLQQQQQLKKNAREEKAAKVLARAGTRSASIGVVGKGGGRGKKRGVPNEGQTEEPGPAENRETGLPDEGQTEEPGATENQETGVPDEGKPEEPGATENPQTGVPDEGKTQEPSHTDKPKGKGPKRSQATAEEGGEAKKQKTTKETRTVADVHKSLYKMNNIGLSYTIHDPNYMGSAIQVLPNHNGYYVLHMKQQQWFVDVAKAHYIQANLSKQGCAVNWQKHGMDYGWRLSMLLAGWIDRHGRQPEGSLAVYAVLYGICKRLQAAHYVATIADEKHWSTYDIQTSPLEENILSTTGFLNLLKKTLRVQPGGVMIANRICTRFCMLLYLATDFARGAASVVRFALIAADVLATMGKRGDTAAAAAPVSAKVQAMVQKALQQHGKNKDKPDSGASNPRPLATPARPPINTPMIETPPAAPEKTAMPGLTQDLAGTQPDEETRGPQLFCGMACFMKSVETPKEPAAATAPQTEPDPESAPAAKATQAEVETQVLDPEPAVSLPPPEQKVEQNPTASPTASKASASVSAGCTSATAEASGGASVHVTATCSTVSAKASVEGQEAPVKSVESRGAKDDLEMHLERLLDEQDEIENAQQRAGEAEQRAKALQALLSALLQQPAELTGERSAYIQAMLRRPATCDIEDVTQKLCFGVGIQPDSDRTVVHMQVDKEPAAETPKESVPAGVPAETSTKESVPAGAPVETSTKEESVAAGGVETSRKESVPAAM
ncbi:unnamed protein product, partial [Symbiodinium microadriaticum]